MLIIISQCSCCVMRHRWWLSLLSLFCYILIGISIILNVLIVIDKNTSNIIHMKKKWSLNQKWSRGQNRIRTKRFRFDNNNFQHVFVANDDTKTFRNNNVIHCNEASNESIMDNNPQHHHNATTMIHQSRMDNDHSWSKPESEYETISTTTNKRRRILSFIEEEIISNFICNPQHVHLTQGTNVHTDYHNNNNNNLVQYLVSMIISFTLDYERCPPTIAKPMIILYLNNPITSINETLDNDGDNTNNNNIMIYPNLTEYPPLQFNHTSETRLGIVQQSHWIYHIHIPHLQAGFIEYKYQIRVQQVLDSINDTDIDDCSQSKKSYKDDYSQKEKEKVEENSISFGNKLLPVDVINSPSIHVLHEEVDTIKYEDGNMYMNATDVSSTNNEIPCHPSFRASNNTEASTHEIIGETKVHSFKTPPLPGQSNTTFAFVGDIGQTDDSIRTMTNIWEHAGYGTNVNCTNMNRTEIEENDYHCNDTSSFDFSPISNVLIAGDMTYADSALDKYHTWFSKMEPLLRSVPISVTVGNHEIECNTNTGDVFIPYEHYFRVPNRILHTSYEMDRIKDFNIAHDRHHHKLCSASNKNFRGIYNYGNSFYSYIHGNVHIIVLNSYHSDMSHQSVQYNWFLQELSMNVNRNITPWLLVMFHVPFYTTFNGHVGESRTMKRVYECLLTDYKVNLVLSGHDHAYMRTRPILSRSFSIWNRIYSLLFFHRGNHNKINNNGGGMEYKGPIYLTIGSGGNHEGHVKKGYRNKNQPESWVIQRNNNEFGYAMAQFVNDTHLYVQWMKPPDNNNHNSDDKESAASFQDRVWIYNTAI